MKFVFFVTKLPSLKKQHQSPLLSLDHDVRNTKRQNTPDHHIRNTKIQSRTKCIPVLNFKKCISLRWAPSISVASALTGTLPFDYHHYMTNNLQTLLTTTTTWPLPSLHDYHHACPPQTGILPLWSRSTTTTTWTPGPPSPWSRQPGCSQPSYPSSLSFSDGENDDEID